jgi:hypothetical protein
VAKSLNELKAENAAAEAAKVDTPITDVKDDIKDEYVEVVEDVKADTDKTKPEDDGEDKPELEPWQLTDEAEASEDDRKTGFVPNHEAAKRRKQAQALKGELSEAKTENEELLARLAALESGTAKPPPQQQVATESIKPKREDFYEHDDPDEAFTDALVDWKLDKSFSAQSTKTQQSEQLANQTRNQEAQQQVIQKSLDDHYGRAAELVADGKVSGESYKNADRMVRMSMDNIVKGRGDVLTDALISTLNSLGKGSEKVIYQLGVNPLKLQELQSKLIADPSGLTASAYLGQLQSQIQTPGKRRSQAPAPGEDVNGEGGSGGKGGTMQKQYAKSNDPSERVSMKRKAKANGIDVSNW